MKNLEFKGFPAYSITKDGRVFSSKCNRFLKGCENTNGYLFVGLYNVNGEISNLYIHKLVAEAYIPNIDNKPQVNHIDGNKRNNSVDNLEWVSASENMLHASLMGLSKTKYKTEFTPEVEEKNIVHNWRNSGKPYAQWSEDEARNAAELIEQGFRICDVSTMTGLCRRGLQFMRNVS